MSMDLSTKYMGLTLKNPIVPSASPLSDKIDLIRRMEDAGASALVMYSLFEEQITMESHQLDHYLSYGTESFGEALSYFPDMGFYKVGPEEYLEKIRKAKEAVEMPIIASINGTSAGGWVEYARSIEDAGADALELNVYYVPTSPHMTSAEVESRYLEVLRAVKKNVSIPVAVKIGPFFSSIPNVAHELALAGADALVLFNRFYQPDFDIEKLEVTPHLVLSSSSELRIPLRWVAILYGRVVVDFAITTGVHNHVDVLKSMMAGASVAMMASELLQNGIGRISEILEALTEWMKLHEYESIIQMKGSMSQINVADETAFERANYMMMLHSWRPDPTGRLT